jgi:hypothetical protein
MCVPPGKQVNQFTSPCLPFGFHIKEVLKGFRRLKSWAQRKWIWNCALKPWRRGCTKWRQRIRQRQSCWCMHLCKLILNMVWGVSCMGSDWPTQRMKWYVRTSVWSLSSAIGTVVYDARRSGIVAFMGAEMNAAHFIQLTSAFLVVFYMIVKWFMVPLNTSFLSLRHGLEFLQLLA